MTLIITSLVLVLIAVYLLYFQRVTPYGMLDLKPAVILKFLPKDKNLDLKSVRANYERFSSMKNKRNNTEIELIEDIQIPFQERKIIARYYDNSPGEARPIIIFLHGGGWCIGSIDTHHVTAKKLAAKTNCAILSIDYSLSPEHIFPNALDEITASVKWVVSDQFPYLVDKDQIMIYGDSAGGNLAITTTLNLQKQGNNFIKRVLAIYPVTDASSTDTESYNNFSTGYFLTKRMMDKFIQNYAPNKLERKNPLVSPVYEKDLSAFPPTYLITAQFDPLRDEGKAFADQLKATGISCTYKNYEGTIHGFFANPLFGRKGDQAVEDLAKYLELVK